MNFDGVGAQQSEFTETPQNITQPCCEPAVFNCSGEGISIVWSLVLPNSSEPILATNPKAVAKGITLSLVSGNGQVSNPLSVTTNTDGLNGLQVQCRLAALSGFSDSDFVTLTIETGLEAAQSLTFSENFRLLRWKAAPTPGLSGTPTYSVTVRDLSSNNTIRDQSDRPCCEIDLPIVAHCRFLQGEVIPHLGSMTGPAATIDRKTPGTFDTVRNVSLNTVRSNSTTDYLQIDLRQSGVRCPMQRLKVSFGEANASPYQTNLLVMGNASFTIEFPTQTKSDNYLVTAIVLDEFGNPQSNYTEFVGTLSEETSTTDAATTPATKIILATLTQAPGSSDQGTQPTIQIFSITPSPAQSMNPNPGDGTGAAVGASVAAAIIAAAASAATVVVVVIVKKRTDHKPTQSTGPDTAPEQDVEWNNLDMNNLKHQKPQQKPEDLQPAGESHENTAL